VLLAITRGPAIPDASFAWTDVRDLAASVLAVAARPPGEHYLVTSETARARDVARRVDSIRGRRGRRLFLPHTLVRTAASLNDLFGGGLVPDLPLRAGLEFVLGTGPIDGTSGGPAIGVPYRPLDETLRDTLGWWAANGVITRAEAGLAAS
jgi:dihydroflavonol-4-reductase